MLRKVIIVLGVMLLTGSMLIGATLQVNGGFNRYSDVSAESLNASVVEFAGLAKEAYLYAQPLLQTYRRMYEDIADDSTPGYIGSFNNLHLRAEVESESNQLIAINAWLDLRTEPLLLHVPAGGGNRGALEVINLYGDKISRIGDSDHDANYLIVARSWKGEVPLGIRQVIYADTDLVQIHSATRVANAISFERLKDWAGQLALVPMSSYTMQPPPKLAARLKLREWDDSAAATKQFIPYLNFMLRFLHPEGTEAEQIERFQRIGIVAGLPRAPTRYSGAIAAGIFQAQEELEQREEKAAQLLSAGSEASSSDFATIGQI